MKITYLGHSALMLETAKHKLLVDPFISGNEMASGIIDPGSLQPDFILLTHAHQDHILDAEAIARRSKAVVVSNFEIATHFEKKGLQVHPMNHGGQWQFSFGKLKYTNAIHTSSFPDGTYGGQPGGFIITSEGKQVYIAGDTALSMDMKLIPLSYKLDLAVLPIGDNFTMGVEDAITASDFIACNTILGCHYDTFGYIKIDRDLAREKFEKAGKILKLPEIGESLMV